MQQYRINYRFLVGLFVFSLLTMVASYFLWSWQINRKATWYRDTALEALEEGDQLKAFEYQEKFAKLRRRDDEARVKLAAIAHDVIQLEGAPRDQRTKAYSILSDTVRRTSDPTARRNFADLLFKSGTPEQAQQAIVHYEELLKTEQDDPELKSLLVQALFRAKDFKSSMEQAFELLGYDSETDTFDAEVSQAADQPEVHWTLATILSNREDKPELARKVIDLMVSSNPENAQAHLYRCYFLFSFEEEEAAKESLQKAFELDPKNSDVLYQRALTARMDDELDEVLTLTESGITEFPEEMRFYMLRSKTFIAKEEPEEAVKVLDNAIAKFGNTRSITLMADKLELLLSQKNYDAAQEMVEELEDLRIPQLKPLIDFQKANFEFNRGNWAAAAIQLRRVRPKLLGVGNYQVRAGFMLGSAYEKLGKLDLAREVYGLVLENETFASDHPLLMSVKERLATIDRRLNRKDGEQSTGLDAVVKRMLKLPESQQDWSRVDDLIEDLAEQREYSEARKLLMKAGVLRLRSKMSEAKALVREAAKIDPDDTMVMFEAAKIQLQELPDGPAKAVRLLKRVESKSGVTYSSRGLLIEAIWIARGEDVASQLAELANGLEELDSTPRAQLLKSIAGKFLGLRDLDEAARFVRLALEANPGDLPLHMMLFEIAFQKRDDAAMRAAQEEILEVVGTEDDSNYVLNEVKRRIIGYKGDQPGRASLEEALGMLDQALELRPQWHELHILYGQLLLVLQRDISTALSHFDDALKYGPPNMKAVTLQTKLLYESGLVTQAIERMDLIPKEFRSRLLGSVEADLLLASGDKKAAFKSAKATAESNPEDAKIQTWFGELSGKVEEYDDAADAFRKAAELNPKSENAWMKLVAVHASQKDFENLEVSLRDAQLSLDPDVLPHVQAKNFELRGQWERAEKIYESLFQKDYDSNPNSAYQMARFYLLWAKTNKEKMPLAIPHINHLLRLGNEGELAADHIHFVWARERAAEQLYATNEYPSVMKALKLLESGSEDGSVPSFFLKKYLAILSTQGDPISVLKAIDMLAELDEKGQLDKSQKLLLAKLYERTNRWQLGKDLMLDMISRYGADKDVWTTYITLLIKQGEYDRARNRINRFEDISDDTVLVARLRGALGYEQGDELVVQRALRSILPSKSLKSALTEKELDLIRAVAGLATAYGEHDLAEKLLRLFVSRKKTQGVFDLMSVITLHGDINESLQYLQRSVKVDPMGVSQLAIQSLRTRRSELSDEQTKQLWDILISVVDSDPSDPVLVLMKAEAYETTERYEEAIAAYDQALNQLEMTPQQAAVAKNNLAYLLAQTDQRYDEAEGMISESIEILGPLADVIDTRAVIRMAREEYSLAVEDMKLALTIDPSAAKYYHLSRAHALAGNSDEAIEAWEKANELEITKEDLPLLEQPGYDATQQLIEQLKTQSL